MFEKFYTFMEWLPVLATIIVLAIIILGIAGDIMNISNEIDCGIITDKYISSRIYRGAVCYFTIEGKKNGNIVQYTFAVTEQEYDKYRIGDYYDRKGQ